MTSSPTELTDPDQNIEVRVCVCGVAPEPLPVNKHLLVNGVIIELYSFVLLIFVLLI